MRERTDLVRNNAVIPQAGIQTPDKAVIVVTTTKVINEEITGITRDKIVKAGIITGINAETILKAVTTTIATTIQTAKAGLTEIIQDVLTGLTVGIISTADAR